MFYYRLSNTPDPEERLEDAAMAKALKDVLGKDLEVVESGIGNADLKKRGIGDKDVVLGRHMKWNGQHPGAFLAPPHLPYWNDPAFKAAAGRSFKACTYNEANAEVARLHAEGKNAFIKSTTTKEFTSSVPVGSKIIDVAEELVFSWLDLEWPVLMVQEAVEMTCEHRFCVMERQIVSHSPVMIPLTPLDAATIGGMVAPKPTADKLVHSPETVKQLKEFAAGLAQQLEVKSCILDCCLIDGKPAAIELNALNIGQFGLYGMDVRDIAWGAARILAPAAGISFGHGEVEEDCDFDM